MNNDFLGHSWGDLPMIFTRDFVTRENHWQIASLVTQKSLFTVTHALFFILLRRHIVSSRRYWIPVWHEEEYFTDKDYLYQHWDYNVDK